ncbi:MAG: hypothetical protein M1833_001994 [Piccolia ochrophora]|nr:MAG: hypothetical protein M1833_001994 [Piccolia ochrophora]
MPSIKLCQVLVACLALAGSALGAPSVAKRAGKCKAEGYVSDSMTMKYKSSTDSNTSHDSGVQIINADGSEGPDITDADGYDVNKNDWVELDAGLPDGKLWWWGKSAQQGSTAFSSCWVTYNGQEEIEGTVEDGGTDVKLLGSGVTSWCTVEFDC